MVRSAAVADDSLWDTSCKDWRERLLAGRSLVPALPLNTTEATDALRTFGNMPLPDVPGNPLLRDAAGPWYQDVVRALFGSFNPDTGVRHLSEVFVLVPKKNSKTTYSAALMLTAVIRSQRPRAEFLMVAPTQEVAELAFAQAVGMVDLEPELRRRFHVQTHLKRIVYRSTGAFLKIKSFDPRVVTGSKPAGVLLDETHVIAEAHDADRVLGQLRGGLVSQPEGFLVQITTQSERPPSGVFASELRKARAVRDGKLRAAMLPVLYEFPDGVDWRDKANWPAVLPNIGRSITIDRLSRDYDSAAEAGQEELRRWASQHLNVEIGVALLSDAWAGAQFWPMCGKASLTLDDVLRRSEVVTIGIDGGGLDDMLGIAVLGREAGTGRWLAWTKAWAHPVAMDRRKANAARYKDFAADGDLTLCESIGDDVLEVAAIVGEVDASGMLDKIGVDPVGIGAVVDALVGQGIEQSRIVGVGQGWKLTGAIKTLERRLAERAVEHSGSRLMDWCVGNAKVEPRGNAVLVTKQAAGVGKIDPLVALFCAVALMALNPEAPSYYASGGELEVF